MPQRRKNPNAFSYFIWLDYKSCYFIIIIFCIQEESDNINNVMDELYREAGTTLLEEPDSSMELMDTHREDEDHIRKIKEFQDYLQMVKIMIKPGCSEEVLKVALNSMSSLVGILAFMSYPKHRSSL
ncbi:pyrophosphate--fructose 6-phosphate 1-phosphotransferase subunit alpha isoform X4 [Gossypium raimondii]|uniref:Pyrophosphate--fructose 6-phosphate 1-phosphotransferase subunit alpha-like n=1 Tax=Gossypium raimondii TaxID=29730 RepID=A0A0D2V309_GOSRA|nr:pyrophosphate--fructose 6-phosphate 1-phosphotransferase subunit alpha isoform X4 [Gossypium raimondii]XP_052488300.1 pyrophosphate--fructose 6-phosphate 1-phosphotransferase subunit alpha isoform X4 [Gossypium raimondii]KJB63315.1 hypothetical protein B456_010G169500 [Gossypium raimondii]